MTLINILFLGILPAGLLMWAGNVIRSRTADEERGKDWLWFLSVGLGLSIIAFITAFIIGDRVSNFTMPFILPITFGFTVTLGLYLLQGRNVSMGKMALIFLLFAILLSWVSFANGWAILISFILVAILTAIAWLMWNQNEKRYLLLFAIEVILLRISIRVTELNRTPQIHTEWLRSILSMGTYLFIPWAGVVLSALLIRRLLSSDSLNWRAMASSLLMVVVLFSMVGYQAMLTSMWDVAMDGLGWIFLWITTSTIGIGSAMLMAWSMPRKHIWAAILFALTVPIVLVGAFNLANYDENHKWGTKPTIMTEQRADKIENAIQRYYKVNNEYPQTLNDLTPKYLLYIPNPYIIPGQDWCYEGGTNYYLFGYVYREFFSSPASVRIRSSASTGEASNANWDCQIPPEAIGY